MTEEEQAEAVMDGLGAFAIGDKVGNYELPGDLGVIVAGPERWHGDIIWQVKWDVKWDGYQPTFRYFVDSLYRIYDRD